MDPFYEAVKKGALTLDLNPELDNTTKVHDSHMNVLITGGKSGDRAVLQDVIFNALEGAGFRNLTYTPNSYNDVPANEVKSVLDAMKENNPEFFEREVSIESADRAWDTTFAPAYPNDNYIPNAKALERVTRSTDGKRVTVEFGDAEVSIRF